MVHLNNDEYENLYSQDLNHRQPSIRLEVDGGLNLENIGKAARSGADTFVAGSAIFNSEDYKQTISQMRQIISKS